jgi:surface antigen
MQLPVRALPVLALLLVAGCSSSPTTSSLAVGPTLPQPNSALATQPAVTPASLPTTAQQPSTAAMNDVSAYLDGSVLSQMSANDKSQAASAQFNALTFGRPGAPRTWTGDKGVSGSVTVGPYVTVNNINCRDFTHTVTISGTPHARKGTACREVDGTWSVAG